MMYSMYRRFADEGLMPNLKRLADEGVLTESYSSIPAWTPTNWATLITGAHTGTHTVSRWFLNMPGPRRAEKTMSAFVGSAVAAETIFEAADRAGLKSVAIHYPAASPVRARLASTVDGFGHPGYGTTPFEVTPALGYTNLRDIPSSYSIALADATGWRELPRSHRPPLEFPIPIITKREGEDLNLMGLVVDTQGEGYDAVAICTERDGQSEVARSMVGEWSQWASLPFVIEGGPQKGTCRFKTLELAADGSRLRLYRSQVMLTEGFTETPELGAELSQRFGPYLEHASILPYVWGIADFKTCMEEVDYHCQWTARAGKYLLEERDFSLLYTHIHLFDYINHHFLSMVDPACPGYDESTAEEGWNAYREAYRTADRMFATLMEDAPEDTAVIVVSDHAAIPQVRATDIYRLLKDRGYLVLKDPSRTFDPNEDFDNIDMERTRVFVTPVRSFEIFVNAPEGSDEYLQVQKGGPDPAEDVGGRRDGSVPGGHCPPEAACASSGVLGRAVRRHRIRHGGRLRQWLLQPRPPGRRPVCLEACQVRRPPRTLPTDGQDGNLLQHGVLSRLGTWSQEGVPAAGGPPGLHAPHQCGANRLPPAGHRAARPVPGSGAQGLPGRHQARNGPY